jgi:hypothetical protein
VLKIKQIKLPGRQSQSYNILSLIAISGELPVSQIKRLNGGGEYKRIKLIPSLKQKKFITTYYNDKLRGYRLTNISKNMLLNDSCDRFSFFFTGNADTNILKSEIKRRLRLKSIAETFVTMQNAGVSIYRDEKPDIFYPKNDSKQILAVKEPAFYNSREIKNYGGEFVKIRNSRLVGVLLNESKFFVVYNTGDSLMKWEHNAEMKASGLILHTLSSERLSHQYHYDDDMWGLMLGNTMEQVYQLLISTGGLKRNYFTLDNTYRNFIYLTNDHNGEVVLKLLCDTEKTKELNYILSQDLYKPNPDMVVENDALDENGNAVLFAYDCNMPRIARFSLALKTYNRNGTIICFDFQTDILRRYCCDNVAFQSININKFERRFFS